MTILPLCVYLAPFFFLPCFLFHGPHVPSGSFREIVLGNTLILFLAELDEKMDIFLMLNMKRQPTVSSLSLA